MGDPADHDPEDHAGADATGRRWRDIQTALLGLDPSDLGERLDRLTRTRRWLRPAAFVGIALLGLTGAASTLVRNWRLVLLEIAPAMWIGAITWQWRSIVLQDANLPVVRSWAALGITVLVLAATSLAYWCNVTFAYTVGQPPPLSISRAYRLARGRSRWIWAAAVATATLHAIVVVWVARTTQTWFAIGLGGIAVLQMYALIALPVAIVSGRQTRRSVRDQVRYLTASIGISGITATPGLVLNRLGVLLIGLDWLQWVAIPILAIATVLQIAGVSSATAVRLANRLET